MTKFRFEDCRLRPVSEDDSPRLLAWRNSDRVRFNMYRTAIISRADHQAWFSKMLTDDRRQYLIFEYRDQPVGTVNVTDIDTANKNAHWGFYIGEEDVPPGLGTAMGVLALNRIFDEIGIRKLNCEVLDFNDRSLMFHKRFGFEEQARYIDHILRDDGPHDVIGLNLTASRWAEVRPSLVARLFED